MRTVKSYRCPICAMSYKSLKPWANHMHSIHPEWCIPDFSDSRLFYYSLTGKLHGTCIICKKDTEWNEDTQKYARFCNNPECKEKYKKTFQNRMIKKYGKVHLCDSPEQQRKMLANRHIAGKVHFSDGDLGYVGSYEKDFLMMMRDFLHFNAKSIMSPSPHTYEYEYEGEKHFYIPDFFIPDLNLEIEIKTHKTTHHKFVEVDFKKEAAKTAMMETIRSINYIVIPDKDYEKFFILLEELKAQVDDLKVKGAKTPAQEATSYYHDHKKAMNSVLESMDILKPPAPKLEKGGHFVLECLTKDKPLPPDLFPVYESDTPTDYYPVYVIVMHSGTGMSNIIKAVTKDEFSHCGISFDYKMDVIYSFGDKKRNFFDQVHGLGFQIDDHNSTIYSEKLQDCHYKINVLYVPGSEWTAMKNRVRFFIQNRYRFKYDFVGLIKYTLHMDSKRQFSYFCSGFVADVLQAGGVLDKGKHYSQYAPQDFASLPESYTIAEGIGFHKYDADQGLANTKKYFDAFKKTLSNPNEVKLIIP